MALTAEGRKLTSQHRRRQVAQTIIADSQARRAWDDTMNLADITGSQPIWKKTMLNLISTWWKISQKEALNYLPKFRQAETGEDAGITVTVPSFSRKQLSADIDWLGATNVLWHIAKGATPEEAMRQARELFIGVFHEAVLTGGRKTVQAWAKADTRAIGWRRVSDGNPCTFCAMLVTRGPVYTSEQKALTTGDMRNKYHPHCGCTVEVVYGDWKPSKLEQHWIDEYYKAAESLPPQTPRTADVVLPIMRKHGDFRDSYFVRRQLRVQQKSSKFIADMQSFIKREGKPRIDWPANTHPIGDQILDHILYGDSTRNIGGHLHGQGIAGKREFPESWDATRIECSIAQVMEHPLWVRKAAQEFRPTIFGAEIDGVQIEVKAYLYQGRYVIERAYPVGGDGVIKNLSNGDRMLTGKSNGHEWGHT